MIHGSAGISVYELLRRPPVARFYGISRIRDIDDSVNRALKAVRFAGKMDISASVIHKAMYADGVGYAAVPVTQKFRVQRVFFEAVILMPTSHFMFFSSDWSTSVRAGACAHGANHQVICNLQLRRGGRRIFLRIYQLKMLIELADSSGLSRH